MINIRLRALITRWFFEIKIQLPHHLKIIITEVVIIVVMIVSQENKERGLTLLDLL
jgi:hypothetical protein